VSPLESAVDGTSVRVQARAVEQSTD
jgi:hypothetical protein